MRGRGFEKEREKQDRRRCMSNRCLPQRKAELEGSAWKRRNAITKGRSVAALGRRERRQDKRQSGSRASGYKRHAGGAPRSVLEFGAI